MFQTTDVLTMPFTHLQGVELRLECDEIMNRQGHGEPTGQAKITNAYNLPCKYIIHTVGPIISYKLTSEDCELLASCYRSCLNLAAKKQLGEYCVLLYFDRRVSLPK